MHVSNCCIAHISQPRSNTCSKNLPSNQMGSNSKVTENLRLYHAGFYAVGIVKAGLKELRHLFFAGSAVAWWLMPRTPDPEVGGSSPTRVKPCCVLEQGTFTPQKVLVIPRKRCLRPNMTEKLFTGTLRINQPTNLFFAIFI